ncbi:MULTISPECIES: hypothetical protein [Peribacillus]|uniref:hypothetical protein n=1 Tax=Peribacillus TaxID=2675229 RepID=UPI000BA67AED|nr:MULTISPECIES: hypothetical protein [Peribacillus]MBD8591253.1 hypothetical protein [Peribacillus simplex]MCM3169645.1 hypothetical protein [Peribacillus frigoritolerans]MEE3955785.1 hypothetical protein [Peribacillus frigoritolerans]PAL01365.1 hypothetical protein B8W99_28045 [Peribacillus simplex]
MDRFDEIALSRIASLLEKRTFFTTPSNATWERILSNAGQSQHYETYGYALKPYKPGTDWDNKSFEGFYSAIKNILKMVYSDGKNTDEFNYLMQEIVADVKIENTIKGGLKAIFNNSELRKAEEDLDKQLKKKNIDVMTLLLDKSIDDFKQFVHNLHILNLDISYSDGKMVLRPFTQQTSDESRNPSLLIDWLSSEHPNIADMYEEAIENYAKGQAVSCISNCRNIIAGIFTPYKDDENKWMMGLRNLSTDAYIENVKAPNNISQESANDKFDFENDKRFNFPRYKLIYQLYAYTCDLGAHSTEAPMIGGKLYPEDTTLKDAQLCLRMTEDVLIWVRERLKTFEETPAF